MAVLARALSGSPSGFLRGFCPDGLGVAAVLGVRQLGAERYQPLKRRAIDRELDDDPAGTITAGDVAVLQDVAEACRLRSWRVVRWSAGA